MQSTEEPQRESLLQSEQESWRQWPRNVSNGLDACCVWHPRYCDICLHNYGKQVTLWLSALEAEWWARAWVLLRALCFRREQRWKASHSLVRCFRSRVMSTCLSTAASPLLQEGAEAPLKVETQPHSRVAFPCPVLSWRVWGQAPDRWQGWGSEPGICVKELDSRKFPESGWPSLKVLSRLCRPLRRKLCLELFFLTMVISCGSHFIHSSNWVVDYGKGHTGDEQKKGPYLLWQTQRTSHHLQ